MKFSSKIEKCGLSPIRKFAPLANEATKKGIKIYHLNIGQPDIETPKEMMEAIRAIDDPVLAYAPSPGLPVMIDAVQNYYEKIGAPLDKSNIQITTAGSEALMMALFSILDDGDEIIIPEPFYTNYNTFVNLTGGSIRPIPCTPEEGYHFASREKIEPLINEHTRAIMFTNPGNPTGTVLTEEELKLVCDIAKEHDLFVIGDEVYREFVYENEPLMSILQLEGFEENAIVIDSVSKRFSACGARIGCMLSRNKELMQQVTKYAQGRLSSPTIDQIGSAALYNVGPEYFDAVRVEYKSRRDTMVEGLSKIPGIIYSNPKGAFYCMAKLPVDNAEDFQTWLLTEYENNGETVMFAPAAGFYATKGSGVNEIRMAYVLKKEDIARAMELLKDAIEKYNNR